jgi:hypothetical protein
VKPDRWRGSPAVWQSGQPVSTEPGFRGIVGGNISSTRSCEVVTSMAVSNLMTVEIVRTTCPPRSKTRADDRRGPGADLGHGGAIPEVCLCPPEQPGHLSVGGVGRGMAQRRQARLRHVRPVHDLVLEGTGPYHRSISWSGVSWVSPGKRASAPVLTRTIVMGWRMTHVG